MRSVKKAPISLYECSHAHILDEDIYCAKGHRLGAKYNGKIPILRLKRGEPLVYRICQLCIDFDRNGESIAQEERGYR